MLPAGATLTRLTWPHRSSLSQQLSFLHKGLLSNLYLHASDCPLPLLQWLFQVRATSLPLGGENRAAPRPRQAQGLDWWDTCLGCLRSREWRKAGRS